MRIRNSRSSFGGFGGGGNRSDSFRQKHKRGQKIRGILLKRVSDDMAWVSIDGDKLLAQLSHTHPEGARLTFIIKQLSPDIILKEVFEFSSGSANSLTLANSFDTARTLFENQFSQFKKSLNGDTTISRSELFIELLATSPPLYTCFMDATHCAQTISNQLEANKMGRILYQPWLISNSRRQITLVRNFNKHETNPLIETLIEFEHEKWGMVRAEFLYKAQKVGYKIKLQHPMHSDIFLRELGICIHPSLATSIECLGVSKLPPSSHGGILAEIMFKST